LTLTNWQYIKPEEGRKIESAVIFLHGYGANGNDLLNIGQLWQKDLKNTLFAAPNAPFKCKFDGNPGVEEVESFMWFDLSSYDKIGEGLKKAGTYLMDYLDEFKKKFSLENNQIVFFGFSQGAMMSLYHLPKLSKNIAGLLAYSGLLFDDKLFNKNINSTFPVGIYHGKEDELIDSNYSLKSTEKLKSLGFDVTYHIQNGLGHGIDNIGLDFGLNLIKNKFKI
tara:strand:- start:46 stop:714 length:669 start_codon:yes stop_codon:yes gene_type:complete